MNLFTRPSVARLYIALANRKLSLHVALKVSLASVGQISASVRDSFASVTLGIPRIVG